MTPAEVSGPAAVPAFTSEPLEQKAASEPTAEFASFLKRAVPGSGKLPDSPSATPADESSEDAESENARGESKARTKERPEDKAALLLAGLFGSIPATFRSQVPDLEAESGAGEDGPKAPLSPPSEPGEGAGQSGKQEAGKNGARGTLLPRADKEGAAKAAGAENLSARDAKAGEEGGKACHNPAAATGKSDGRAKLSIYGQLIDFEHVTTKLPQPTPREEPNGMSAAHQAPMTPTEPDTQANASTEEMKQSATAIVNAVEREKRPGKVAPVTPDAAVTAASAKSEGAGELVRTELSKAGVTKASSPETLEAVRKAIETAAAALPRVQAASHSVVLTPDKDTQLLLHFKWEARGGEAVAVMQRGDFRALGADWTHLQSRLAEQGIRLAPLTSGAQVSTGSSGGQSPFERQEAELGSAEDGFVMGPAIQARRPRGASVSKSAREREWWA